MKPSCIEIDCSVEIADTPEDLCAHVALDGADAEAGDLVIVHESPTRVEYGRRIVCARRATIVRAGWLRQLWARASGYFSLAELYEVSFSSASLHRDRALSSPRRPRPHFPERKPA